MSAKNSNLKRVIQMTSSVSADDMFDAEARIAGLSCFPGFIAAYALASTFSNDIQDKIISYWNIKNPSNRLPDGSCYAWVSKIDLTIVQVAQELRRRALEPGIPEKEKYKFMAAYHSLLGQFKEATQCHTAHDIAS